MKRRLLVGMALLAAVTATCVTGPSAQARTIKRRRAVPSWRGCWVKIWKDHDHGGWYAFLQGPRNLPNMKVAGRNWGDRISGLQTGPRTWLKVFKDQGMHGDVLVIPPNTSYGSLAGVHFDDSIDSMIIQNHPFR